MRNEMTSKNLKGELKGFKTMWLRYDENSSGKNQLFFKEHAIRNQAVEHPRGKTLFMLNVPPYVTTEALRKAFSSLCGNVSNVYFANSKGFKTAYLVFEKESTLQNVLEIPDDYVLTLCTKDNICLTGMAKWVAEYNNSIGNEAKMKEEIEAFMRDYDNRIAEKAAREKAMKEKQLEDDGWVTVTGRKKRGQFAIARKESALNKVQHKEEQKNKKKELRNFYTFQIRESKKQNLAELRKKFELDKKRLEDLKSKRTFRPF